MDETGYRVGGIEADGRLRVERRGSFYDSVLLHRPVLVHTQASGSRARSAGAAVRGVLELAEAQGAGPESLVEVLPEEGLRVDIGAGSPEEVTALGVAVGDGITVPKEFERLGPHRGYGRGVDDRAGCAALIAALHALAPDIAAGRGPAGRLTFVWSVREEVGLEGAKSLAERLDPDEVYAVDTFVSSDSPLERDAFAFAPLGREPSCGPPITRTWRLWSGSGACWPARMRPGSPSSQAWGGVGTTAPRLRGEGRPGCLFPGPVAIPIPPSRSSIPAITRPWSASFSGSPGASPP